MGFSHSLRYAISIPFYILLLLNVNCFQILSDHWFSAVSIVGGWAVHHFSFSLFSFRFSFFFFCHLHGLLPLFEVRHPHLILYSPVTQRQLFAESLGGSSVRWRVWGGF